MSEVALLNSTDTVPVLMKVSFRCSAHHAPRDMQMLASYQALIASETSQPTRNHPALTPPSIRCTDTEGTRVRLHPGVSEPGITSVRHRTGGGILQRVG